MSTGFEAFKSKMKTNEHARTAFVADVHRALERQGVDISNSELMAKLGFKHGHLGDLGNVASSNIITIVA